MDIKTARKTLGLSQEAFAKKLDVSVRTIGNWENGSVSVPPSKLDKIRELVVNAPHPCDVIKVGNNSPGGGKNNTINTDLSEALLRALEEISAQRRVAEEAQRQAAELLEILKSKLL